MSTMKRCLKNRKFSVIFFLFAVALFQMFRQNFTKNCLSFLEGNCHSLSLSLSLFERKIFRSLCYNLLRIFIRNEIIFTRGNELIFCPARRSRVTIPRRRNTVKCAFLQDDHSPTAVTMPRGNLQNISPWFSPIRFFNPLVSRPPNDTIAAWFIDPGNLDASFFSTTDIDRVTIFLPIKKKKKYPLFLLKYRNLRKLISIRIFTLCYI